MGEKGFCRNAKERAERMTAVDQAQAWAKHLVSRETRGPGDTENAMRRLEARYGIPWRTFWSLRYRPPSEMFVSVYLRIKTAYEAEVERQIRHLKHELEITKAKAGVDIAVVRAVEALVGADEDVKE